MRKVLVSGSTGFLGTHLLPALHDSWDVLELQEYIRDVTDERWLENTPPADAVVHLAAQTVGREAYEDPLQTYRVNVIGTLHVLEYCRRHDAKLVFASTNVYGIPEDLPVKESHPLNANNPYTRSKLAAEHLIRGYAEDFGIPAMSLRFTNIYGPGQRDGFLIPSIIKQAFDVRSGKSEQVQLGRSSPKRDFLFISDAIDAIQKALAAERPGYTAVNIGTGKSTSVGEVVKIIQDTIGDFSVQYEPNGLDAGVEDIRFDASLAKDILGWKASRGIESGLRETIASLRLE